MMKVISSSETPVLTRAIRRNIPEDTILHLILLCMRILQPMYTIRGHALYRHNESIQTVC
jgi:hypothetical protein